jgi:pyruvate-ferredoxin/flavodoxin oxidoreductase
MSSTERTIDGNEAAATIADALSDLLAIYPITPATPMVEQAAAWARATRPIRGARGPK